GTPPSPRSSPEGDDNPELPEGIIIGTPRPDDPIVRRDPPKDEPSFIPTTRPSSYDSDGDGFLTPPELITALRDSFPTYVWAPSYQLDLEALIVAIEEEAEKYPVLYENGYERSALMFPQL